MTRLMTLDEQTPAAQPLAREPVAWLAGAAVALSALHFWPWSGNRAWELLAPANVLVIIGAAVLIGQRLLRSRDNRPGRLLPDVSILAYVLVAGLSAAITPDIGRTLAVEAKLCLALIAGYALFRGAASLPGGGRTLHATAAVAVAIATAACLVARATGRGQAGFFDSGLKYGTYVGMLLPMACGYLLLGRQLRSRVLGALLLAAGAASAPSMGCLLAIVAGMASLLPIARRARARSAVLVACLLGGAVLCLAWPTRFAEPVVADCRVREADGATCRQRYIEWQVFLNLVGHRVSGTGLGCINTYRSMFYGSLPKANTLAPFDQNGWLAAAAETGVMGLACLCWGYSVYLGHAFRASRRQDYDTRRSGASTLAGLVAAGVANVFCSMQYNGLLIVFALLMALAAVPTGQEEPHDRSATMA